MQLGWDLLGLRHGRLVRLVWHSWTGSTRSWAYRYCLGGRRSGARNRPKPSLSPLPTRVWPKHQNEEKIPDSPIPESTAARKSPWARGLSVRTHHVRLPRGPRPEARHHRRLLGGRHVRPGDYHRLYHLLRTVLSSGPTWSGAILLVEPGVGHRGPPSTGLEALNLLRCQIQSSCVDSPRFNLGVVSEGNLRDPGEISEPSDGKSNPKQPRNFMGCGCGDSDGVAHFAGRSLSPDCGCFSEGRQKLSSWRRCWTSLEQI